MSRLRIVRLIVFPIIATLVVAFSGASGIVKPQTASAATTTPTQHRSTLLAPRTSARAAATVSTTTITLNANPTSVRLQDKSTLSGVLTSTDALGTAKSVPNEPIEVQKSSGTGTWVPVASGMTDANGSYTATLVITSTSASFRAVFAGDSTYVASQSQPVTVTAFKATTKIFNTGPSQVKAETLTSCSIHFEVYDSRVSSHPPVVGAAVDIYRRDVYGGSWMKVSSIVTNSAGNVAWRAKVSTPTEWKLVGHSTATSLAVNWGPYRPKVIPIGAVYTLPTSAPKPAALAPQPGAVGTGAHPYVSGIPQATWDRMTGISWHSGCPIGRSQLAMMTVNYWGFDGYRHRGTLVFRSSHKSEFVSAFTKLYNDHIPLHGMYLVDKFGYSSRTNGGNDYASMEHDNTSAFNCRWVDGKRGTLSPHAYGTAVDINPYENPYHSAEGWTPNKWWRDHNTGPYTWRSRSDPAVQDMLQAGFHWTYGNEDSQHFDT